MAPEPVPLPVMVKLQLLRPRDSADRKIAIDIKGGRTGLYNFGRLKCDGGEMFDIEKIFSLQLVIFHAASGVHGGCIDLDVQHTRGDVW